MTCSLRFRQRICGSGKGSISYIRNTPSKTMPKPSLAQGRQLECQLGH